MGLTTGVELELQEGTMYVNVLGTGPDDEDMGLLIGRHGQTLEALQWLTRVVVGHRPGVRWASGGWSSGRGPETPDGSGPKGRVSRETPSPRRPGWHGRPGCDPRGE